MADFIIVRDVWLHGKVYSKGAEDQLAEIITPEKKAEQVARGALRLTESSHPQSWADDTATLHSTYPVEADEDFDEDGFEEDNEF